MPENKIQNMLQLFAPGDVLYGYCNGHFGRDSYATKTCVLVRPSYAIFEFLSSDDRVRATVLNFYDDGPSREDVAKWKIEADPEND